MARAERERTNVELDAPALPAAPYLNVLSVSSVAKQVPYEGTRVRRMDGGTNHGFTNLAEHPDAIDTIPELSADPALRSLMAAIGRPGTGLFAIACDSQTIADERGCRHSGYVELALNDRAQASDPAQYFRLFLDFDRLLRRRGFSEPVSFQWEICPTRFTDVPLEGFAVDVRVDTEYQVAAEAAVERWGRALAALEELVIRERQGSQAPIYLRRP